MDRLWTPWRYSYIQGASPRKGCIFCEKPAAHQDEENLIVFRGERNFVILNAFPYTNGHVMIAPYQHVATLEAADGATLAEMMRLTQTVETRLRALYRPDGINLGMNLGECAGAGVAGHIHMHVLPRWCGDANFMSVVGETRVLPEDLRTTYQRMLKALADAPSSAG
jgi:ATP adenylyltransferase